MAEAGWYDAGEVKPRNVADNPRCLDCKSDDPRGGVPMFHPEHKWGPCIATSLGGDRCPCRAHQTQLATQGG